MPKLLVVGETRELPEGIKYVVSFVELWGWGTVVRMVGLSEGFVARMLEFDLFLRDDTGESYSRGAMTSGGMVLPEEVVVGFAGVLNPLAQRVEVVDLSSGRVLASARLSGGGIAPVRPPIGP